MNVPKANIWQELRANALKTIPEGVKLHIREPQTLQLWRTKGSYSILSVTPKQIKVCGYSEQYGEAVASDIESLFDHIAEHRVAVHHAVTSGTWVSPAWFLVTVYYWCFFAVLILGRLFGYAHVFLQDDFLKTLLANHGALKGNRPGAGSFRITKGVPVNVNQTELIFEKMTDVIHKGAWHDFANFIGVIFKNRGNKTASLNEFRLFQSLTGFPFGAQFDWPSALRNLVNYRPGFAYREVRKETNLKDMLSFVKQVKYKGFEELVNDLDEEISNCNVLKTKKISTALPLEPCSYGRLMFVTAVALTTIAEELYEEVASIRSFDQRWRGQRLAFFRDRGLVTAPQQVWPYV